MSLADRLNDSINMLSYVKSSCCKGFQNMPDEAIQGLYLILNNIENNLEIIKTGILSNIKGGG